jgi:hypothetical protein
VTLIPGTFIGPEVTTSVRDIFAASLCPVTFQTIEDFHWDNLSHRNKLKNNPAVLIGNLGEAGDRYIENVNFYKHLDLYVKVLHTFHLPNVRTVYPNIDFVVIKDNLEGEYSGIEHEVIILANDTRSTLEFLSRSKLLPRKIPEDWRSTPLSMRFILGGRKLHVSTRPTLCKLSFFSGVGKLLMDCFWKPAEVLVRNTLHWSMKK